MRAGSLSNDQIIDLLNGYFVPVYIPLHHYGYGEAHSPLYFEKPVVIPAAEKVRADLDLRKSCHG